MHFPFVLFPHLHSNMFLRWSWWITFRGDEGLFGLSGVFSFKAALYLAAVVVKMGRRGLAKELWRAGLVLVSCA